MLKELNMVNNRREVSLSEFGDGIRGVFNLDKLPGLSLIQLRNFLDEDNFEEMEDREHGFLSCDEGLDHLNLVHHNIYREVRTAHGEEDFLAGIPEHPMESQEKRDCLIESLKKKILEFIELEVRYLEKILNKPILYDIVCMGQELSSLIKNEKSDYHLIVETYDAWARFCEDYIRLCTYWEFTGALIYGHAQYDQYLLFLYKTQGVWVGEDVSLLKARNRDQFKCELERIHRSKNFILRLFN